MFYEIDYSRKKILSETDLQELLEAGRDVLSKAQVENDVSIGGHKLKYYKLPENIKIPHVIRRLHILGYPHVRMEEDSLALIISTNNRVGCVGIIIYPENYNKQDYIIDANKELISGLWYFDEEYHDNPGYDKKNDEIRKK